MDPKPDAPMILAPARSSGARRMYLPGENDRPPVDEYLDPPEITRYERVDGPRQLASPATAEHGDPHFRLDQLLGAHLAPGYVGSVDLKTRVSAEQEFASDTCVRREGIDPETDARYLEELVFEVVYQRSDEDTKSRAKAFAARGVRRQIAIFVKSREVKEWSTAQNGWRVLDKRRSLRDPCLVRPLALRALFSAAEAEVETALALEAKGNPAIVRMKEESEARGRAIGRAEALVESLEDRGFTLSEEDRARALATTDLVTLRRWSRRALTASSLDEVFDAESGKK
jgi:Uma2 family endonuclease